MEKIHILDEAIPIEVLVWGRGTLFFHTRPEALSHLRGMLLTELQRAEYNCFHGDWVEEWEQQLDQLRSAVQKEDMDLLNIQILAKKALEINFHLYSGRVVEKRKDHAG